MQTFAHPIRGAQMNEIRQLQSPTWRHRCRIPMQRRPITAEVVTKDQDIIIMFFVRFDAITSPSQIHSANWYVKHFICFKLICFCIQRAAVPRGHVPLVYTI